MNEIVSLSSSTSFGYPELTEDPKKKNKEYITQYGKALLSEYMRRSENQNWYHGRAKARENLSYARGEQDFSKFVGYFNTKERDAKIKPWERLKLKDLKIMPKYFRIVQEKLDQVQFDAICTPVDSFARQQKEEYASKLRFAMDNAAFLQSLGIDPSGMVGDGIEIPVDEDELQMQMDSYQNQEAVDIEIKLAIALFIENDWEQIDKELDDDCKYFGCCLFTDYVANGRTYIKRIDPRNGIILPSRYEDHRDMVHGGYLETITLAELRAEAGGDLTEKELQNIASLTSKSSLYHQVDSRLGNPMDSRPIEVFRFQFKSKDQYVAYKNEKGIVRKGIVDYKPRKTKNTSEVARVSYNAVYEGTLVLGTMYSYGCRKMQNQKRDRQWSERISKAIPSSDCLLTLYAYAPNAIDGVFMSMVDEIKAPMDNIVRDYIKLNDEIARTIPKGYAINHAHLGNVVMQSGGQNMSKPELFNLFLETGYLNYSSQDAQGKEIAGEPLIATGYGLSDSVEKYWNLIQNSIRLIEQITGINDVVAGNNQSAEIGKAVAELKVEAGVSSLTHLFRCKRKRFEAMCKCMGLRIQSLENDRPITGTYVRGNGQAKYVGANPSVADRIFHFYIENRPSAEEWREFYMDLKVALQQQQITAADMAQIRIIKNLKQAYYTLAARQKRNEKRLIAQKEREIQLNNEGSAVAAERAEAAKQATLKVELGVEKQLEALKHQNAIILQRERYDREDNLEMTRQTGKIYGKEKDGENQLAKTVAQGEVNALVAQATEQPQPEPSSAE